MVAEKGVEEGKWSAWKDKRMNAEPQDTRGHTMKRLTLKEPWSHEKKQRVFFPNKCMKISCMISNDFSGTFFFHNLSYADTGISSIMKLFPPPRKNHSETLHDRWDS